MAAEDRSAGVLFVVGTPIGNLEDVSARAIETLRRADVILAEDTRITRRLLARYDIETAVASYHAHTPESRREELVGRMAGQSTALVSDAGTPGVSDPGAALVAAAAEAGHEVIAVPGPSAVAAALSIAGMPADRFTFVGFLPRKANARRELLREEADRPYPLVAFESPHRLRDSLRDIAEVLGDRRLFVGRELTKHFEEGWRGTVEEARSHWDAEAPRGEFTLVIDGAPPLEPEPWADDRIRAALDRLRAEGMGAKDASRALAEEAGRPAREIYRLWDHDGGRR